MPEMRALGQTGINVSPLCFGGNVFGWTVDEGQSHRLLDAFVDAGFNFIDTADVYSRWVPGHQGGESESILGQWFKQSGKRDKVVLATKVGKPMGEGKSGLKAAYIREAVDASLKRLQTDYIDLYYTHEDDLATPLEETLEALSGLIQAGKVRSLGASNYSGARLAQAARVAKGLNVTGFQVLQPGYNLYDRTEYEKELLPVVQEQGLAVAPFYALAAGFLTGKYRSTADAAKSVRGAKVVETYLNERGQLILQKLDEVASRYVATPGQVAIAWLLKQPGIVAPIASATTSEQLDELLFAARLRLDNDALQELTMVSA
ncbi:aldo/keto reductase [Lampropedia puyangensis]|uniref:Aldo/keto reductase n=1 Tax=Lampropedia puyangensis TaxID=1330072 RepID=A0A4S8EVY4_9BURK|nr:aldo/keto reductase [Lampropedia puyangensis]THT97954.1 aldo/keto reductase [Lampropedia puyangensis]